MLKRDILLWLMGLVIVVFSAGAIIAQTDDDAQDDDGVEVVDDDDGDAEEPDDDDDADDPDDGDDADDPDDGDDAEEPDDDDDADDPDDDDGEEPDDDDADDPDDGDEIDDEEGPRVSPRGGKVQQGKTRRFRFRTDAGGAQDVNLVIVESSDEGVATIAENGTLSGLEGGWVIIGAQDADTGDIIAVSDTVWIAAKKTKVNKSRGGRAFADDLATNVNIPPGALKRDAKIKLEKVGKNDLPEKAQGKGKVVVVFDISALDAVSEEDISDEGFEVPVEITLSYTDEDLEALGLTEDDLGVGVFDEIEEVWDELPDVEVDTENNTITVATNHFSLWGVIESSDPATAIEATTWGSVKAAAK